MKIFRIFTFSIMALACIALNAGAMQMSPRISQTEGELQTDTSYGVPTDTMAFYIAQYNIRYLTASDTLIGDFPEEALNKYKETVAPIVEQYIDSLSALSEEDLKANIEKLNDAYAELYPQMVKPKAGTWYLIKPTSIDPSVANRVMAAGGDYRHTYGTGYSYVLSFTGMSANANRSWVLKADENGNFVIQNAGNGGYLGPLTGSGLSTYDYRPIMWHNPKAFKIVPFGSGQIGFVEEDGYYVRAVAKWYGIGYQYQTIEEYDASESITGYDNMQYSKLSFELEPTEENHSDLVETHTYVPGTTSPLYKGCVVAVTKPYTIKGLPTNGDGETIKGYELCGTEVSDEDDSTITAYELHEISNDTIAAGKPVIYIMPGEYDKDAPVADKMIFEPVINSNIVTTPDTINGLASIVDAWTTPDDTYAHFDGDSIKLVDKGTQIRFPSAVIIPSMVKIDEDATIDAVVYVKGAYATTVDTTSMPKTTDYGIFIDSTAFYVAQYNIEHLTAGDSQIGDFPQEALDKYEETVTPLLDKYLDDLSALTPEQMTRCISILNNAYTELCESMIKPEANKWYIIKPNDPSTSIANNILSAGGPYRHTYGQRWSYVLNFRNESAASTYVNASWVFNADTAGNFVIQNAGNGGYFGPLTGSGNETYDYRPIMWYEPKAFRIMPLGNGQVALIEKDGYYVRGNASWYNLGLTYSKPSDLELQDGPYSWTIEATEENHSDVMDYESGYSAGQIVDITKPYDIKGLPVTSEGATVQGYTLCGTVMNEDSSAITGFALKALPADEVIKAGTPVLYISQSTTLNFTPVLNTAININPDTVNGLASVVDRWLTNSDRIAYFSGDSVYMPAVGSTIYPQSAVILVDMVNNTDDFENADMVIYTTGAGINTKVASITRSDEPKIVNVYTADGVLVRKGVSAASATDGLSKGIYIVGKRKVLVK